MAVPLFPNCNAKETALSQRFIFIFCAPSDNISVEPIKTGQARHEIQLADRYFFPQRY